MVHEPLRSADVRDRNQKLVLRLLFRNGPMAQSQVVQSTGLKAPTVFRIFAKLEEEQQIRLCDDPAAAHGRPAVERKGRRPAYYGVVPDSIFAVGVDFSTAGASVIVVNFVNEVIHHHTRDFPPGVNCDEILGDIGDMISSGIETCGFDLQRLAGIGIGAPGIVDTRTGVVVEYSRIAGMSRCNVREHFESRFSVPVFVHNNASIIAASEHRYSPVREYDSVLAVLVRGGVGGAFVNHGEVFVNGSITALEMGRMSMWTSDYMAGRDATAATELPTLERLVGEKPLLELLRAETQVTDWADAQERLAETRIAQLIAEPAVRFAVAVRNTYQILRPEVVLVISRYGKLAEVLTKAVRGALPEAQAVAVTYDPLKACHGATDLVYGDFFSDQPRLCPTEGTAG